MSSFESANNSQQSASEPNSSEKQHSDAWIEQREKFVLGAIDSVLASKKEEILEHPENFGAMVLVELYGKSELNNQIPPDRENYENFKNEFDYKNIIVKSIYDFFKIPDAPNQKDLLIDALKKYYRVS